MSTQNVKCHIAGFEDYNVIGTSTIYFTATYDQYLPYGFETNGGSYIINENLPVKICNIVHPQYSWMDELSIIPDLCYNHPELLDSAKKVYVHSSCKLSRSMMAEKYKKSLNPYLSDAVVIPNPDLDYFDLKNCALFVNDEAKLIAKVTMYNDDTDKEVFERLRSAEQGSQFRDFISCNLLARNTGYNHHDLLNAELMYVGEVLFVPHSQSWAIDVLTNKIPTNKIVFEDSVQKSLGCESNKLDFNSLVSIFDMLNSSDEDNVSAGLKALSMMDWMHYPNSVKFILNQAERYKWIWNKALNSTSVKFMLKSISPNVRKRSGFPGNYDEEIYEQDYELFTKLKMHFDKISPDNILDIMRFMNFMTVNNGMIVPKLKS